MRIFLETLAGGRVAPAEKADLVPDVLVRGKRAEARALRGESAAELRRRRREWRCEDQVRKETARVGHAQASVLPRRHRLHAPPRRNEPTTKARFNPEKLCPKSLDQLRVACYCTAWSRDVEPSRHSLMIEAARLAARAREPSHHQMYQTLCDSKPA